MSDSKDEIAVKAQIALSDLNRYNKLRDEASGKAKNSSYWFGLIAGLGIIVMGYMEYKKSSFYNSGVISIISGLIFLLGTRIEQQSKRIDALLKILSNTQKK